MLLENLATTLERELAKDPGNDFFLRFQENLRLNKAAEINGINVNPLKIIRDQVDVNLCVASYFGFGGKY